MYQKFFIFLLLISSIGCHNRGNLNTTFWNQIQNDQQVFESWTLLSQQTLDLDLLTSGLASRLENLLEYTPNITSKCSQSLINMKKDAQNMKSWAIKALDSWGKPSGIFTHGTFSFLGDYDTCLENDNLEYCTVYLRPLLPRRTDYANLNTKVKILNKFINDKDKAISIIANNVQILYYSSLRIGICLPSDCSFNEVNNLLQTVSSDLNLSGKLSYCETNQVYEKKLDVYAIVAIILFSTAGLLTVIGTIFDRFKSENNSEVSLLSNCILAFSLRKNFVNLFKGHMNIKQFECLNGIRVFTTIWIIFNHTFLWMNHYSYSNTFNIFKFLNNLPLNGFMNGFFAVDTFFLISGVLSTYITFTSTKGIYQNFNLFLYLISRYLRLTPGALFSMLGFFVLPYLGSGPFFSEVVRSESANCYSHWFSNLIYLQTNIANEDSSSICNLPTWWLSVEMKLHLLSIAVIICLFFRKQLAFVLVFISIVCSILWALIEHLQNAYPPFTMSTIPEIEEFWKFSSEFLHKMHIHIGPFFIGLLVGYLLAKESCSNLSRKHKVIGWTLSGFLILFLLYAPYYWVIGNPYSSFSASLYASTCQTIWCMCIAWFIIACVNGFGGLVDKFLSLKVFRPISRIIYMTFLTHGQILILYSGTRTKLLPLETSNLYYLVVGHLFNSIIYGFIMTLLIESPTLNLIKLLVKKTNESSNDLNNNDLSKDKKSNAIRLEEI